MWSPSIFQKEKTVPVKDFIGIAKIAANVTKIKEGFKIPRIKSKLKANVFTDEEWDFVFEKMKTMAILDIAELPGVNISASRMYEISRKLKIPRIERKPAPKISRLIRTGLSVERDTKAIIKSHLNGTIDIMSLSAREIAVHFPKRKLTENTICRAREGINGKFVNKYMKGWKR